MPKIRDYILEKQIGIGGVGEVWRARHERLNIPVAIKLIQAHLCRDGNIYQRFEQEAAIMAKLEHPHIVRIHDFFPHENNACLVMTYIDGGSLQDRLHANRPLPLETILRVSKGILDALNFAHQKLTIHRDVKPSNILVAPDAHPYLTDFGIALILGKTRTTKFGTNIGTPEYMSPEQIRGETLDHRTDVYSFGCVLYEMLAGRPPFGSTEDGAMEFTIMKGHIEDLPAPLHTYNGEVIPQMEEVVRRALEKDRDKRFGGCGEMAKALKRKAAIEVSSSKPQGPRRAFLTAAVALLLGAAISAIGFFGYSNIQPKLDRDELIYNVADLLKRLEETEKEKSEAGKNATQLAQKLKMSQDKRQYALSTIKQLETEVSSLKEELVTVKNGRNQSTAKLTRRVKELEFQLKTNEKKNASNAIKQLEFEVNSLQKELKTVKKSRKVSTAKLTRRVKELEFQLKTNQAAYKENITELESQLKTNQAAYKENIKDSKDRLKDREADLGDVKHEQLYDKVLKKKSRKIT